MVEGQGHPVKDNFTCDRGERAADATYPQVISGMWMALCAGSGAAAAPGQSAGAGKAGGQGFDILVILVAPPLRPAGQPLKQADQARQAGDQKQEIDGEAETEHGWRSGGMN